jgi:hypothetical protein
VFSVQVFVGRDGSLNYTLGSLSYASNSSAIWIGIPLIIGIVGGVLLIAVIILVLFLVRRSSMKERDYKRLLAQFDQMERSVREQCKQS